MQFPKHKPALLDGRRPGAREDFYSGNFDSDGGMKGWERVEKSQERERNFDNTVAEAVKAVRIRFDIAGEHIAGAKTRNTQKLIDTVRRIVGDSIAHQVRYSDALREVATWEKKIR